ncbi:MAG: hypothetical protein AAFX54_16250 [Pseudomonadota bacterium]
MAQHRARNSVHGLSLGDCVSRGRHRLGCGGAFYTVAGIGFIIFIYDLVFAFAEGPTEQRRLTRHLWRMGFSFFLATGIFFFGNNHVLPEMLRIPMFLSAPVIAVIMWTLFYALSTRFSKRTSG